MPQNFIPLIGIFNAFFILIFTAHLLGCAFIMIADSEADNNWLVHYQPALAFASNDVRYITALYWAMIRWVCKGHGRTRSPEVQVARNHRAAPKYALWFRQVWRLCHCGRQRTSGEDLPAAAAAVLRARRRARVGSSGKVTMPQRNALSEQPHHHGMRPHLPQQDRDKWKFLVASNAT